MNKSENIGELITALSLVQSEVENADKKSVNPHFKSKYADLAEILNTVRPVCSKHGVSVIQFPSFSDGVAHVETIIAHKSGEWMSEKCSAPVSKQDPQGVGSAITYLRRYSLAAAIGIAQEDDDAERASTVEKKYTPPTPLPTPVKESTITDKQRKELMAMYNGVQREDRLADANFILKKAKPEIEDIKSFSELTERMAKYLIAELGKQKAAMGE